MSSPTKSPQLHPSPEEQPRSNSNFPSSPPFPNSSSKITSTISPSTSKRPTCLRCSRPTRVCICFALPPTPTSTSTPVLILQTSSESKAKVRTADLIPLILCNARILPTTSGFDAQIPSDAILLFPGPSAKPLYSLHAKGRTLVVLDATWDKAKRVLGKSKRLQAIQRASISEEFLGRPLFRARKPPTKSFLCARSTAEAVAGALQCVEGEQSRDVVALIRRCVHEASEMQLQFVREKGEGAGRHRRDRVGYEEGWYNKIT